MKFISIPNPEKRMIEELEDLYPFNPFFSNAFYESCLELGYSAILFGCKERNKIINHCIGLISDRFLRKSILINSMHCSSYQNEFWYGFQKYCKKNRIWTVNIENYFSEPFTIPKLFGETERFQRREYTINLDRNNLYEKLSKNHKRNINKAKKNGFVIKRTQDYEASHIHLELILQSFKRREMEIKKNQINFQLKSYIAYLKNNSGEIFQAINDKIVHSSILILKSKIGGYYQSPD